MEKIALKSFAKINLYLEIKAKRPDGFHNIETIFQAIDLADDITLARAGNGITLTCNHPEVPLDNRNIAFKAAELILLDSKVKSGVNIDIRKNIPVTAGLGGGSSNAAAVLNGCNKLFNLDYSYDRLQRFAAVLGSDVPFFLKSGTAFGEGRGELLTGLNPIAETYIILITEGVKPSTGKIYSEFTKALTKAGTFAKKLEEFKIIKNAKGGDLAKLLYNDLETPAKKYFPVLYEVKDDLLASGAIGALMSGSGPTVFGVAESKEVAEKIAKKLSIKYQRVIVTKTVNTGYGS